MMEKVVTAIAPKAAELTGLELVQGQLYIVIKGDAVPSLSFRCTGSYTLLFLPRTVECNCEAQFETAEKEAILTEVIEALQ